VDLSKRTFIIQRHANTSPLKEGQSDLDRVLSEKGLEQAKRAEEMRQSEGFSGTECRDQERISSIAQRCVVTITPPASVHPDRVIQIPELYVTMYEEIGQTAVHAIFKNDKTAPLRTYHKHLYAAAALMQWGHVAKLRIACELAKVCNPHPYLPVLICTHAILGQQLAHSLCEDDRLLDLYLCEAQMIFVRFGVFKGVL
jgi:hypothetical protein